MTRRPWTVFLPLAVLLLLVAVLGVALKSGGGEGSKFAQHVGEPARATKLPLLGASQAAFATQDWLGRAYLVNFFASWCVPCRSEHDALLRLAKAGIPIVGIAFKDKPEAVAAFLGKEGDPYRAAAADKTGATGIDWGITGVPETFLIDSKGVIRFHAVGPLGDKTVAKELLPLWNEVKR
jgi:DsbE subfamily thiol:disulfide oxidoreductase